jgi:signal transduction histidine kinase
LQHLILNILDQAKIQAGMLALKRQRFNLSTMLEKCSQSFETSLKQKNLSYTLSIGEDVPVEINSDPERLNQVISNLIGNAVKFTSQGGVNIKVFTTMDETLSIEVTDTGAGIPEEQLPDIFEAFRRATNYVQREQQGAGLGLSITREIVARMGGQISVFSTVGVGSTFVISLPLENVA